MRGSVEQLLQWVTAELPLLQKRLRETNAAIDHGRWLLRQDCEAFVPRAPGSLPEGR